MKRHAKRPRPDSHDAPHHHPVNRCRALVLVDGSGIRKKIKTDYEKALRDLEKARRQLDQFHQTDLPLFTRWLNTHFGALLTELRELSQKITADEDLIFQVETETMFSGCSAARAYQRVMELRENPEPPQPQPHHPGDGATGGEKDPSGSHPESGPDEDGADPMKEFMNEFFRTFGSGAPPQDQHDPWNGRRPQSAAPVQESRRLKELYRAVVRRLHPDLQREMTPQKTEWWHQAQAAYEAGDAEQMEAILTLCEIGDAGTTAHTSASLLQRITAQLKKSLREINRQLAGRRRDPAWNYSRRTDHETLAVRMRRMLMDDLEGMRHQYRTIQETIASWKAAAERLKKPRRRKNNPQQHMEFF